MDEERRKKLEMQTWLGRQEEFVGGLRAGLAAYERPPDRLLSGRVGDSAVPQEMG